MRRVNVEPRPSSLHTATEPPWLLATCLTMARPRPVPAGAAGPGLVDPVEALEDAVRSLRGMPMPLSVTAISANPDRARAATAIRFSPSL